MKLKCFSDLRTRLVVSIVLVTLLISVAGLVFNLDRDMNHIRQGAVKSNLLRLKALKIDFVKVIIEHSPDYAAELVDRLNSFPDIRNLILHTLKGAIVFRYNRDSSDFLVLPDIEDFSVSTTVVKSDDSLLLHNPVLFDGEQYGWVTIRVSAHELQDQIREYTLTLLFLIAGTVIISLLLSALIGHYFTRPIRTLAAFTRRISHTREFDRQAYTREAGDVGDLYSGVNLMLKEISAAEQEIARLNEARMRNIIESSLDGVITINSNGLITYWGKQNIKIFGWLEREALGKSLATLIIPEHFRKQYNDGILKFLEVEKSALLNKRILLEGLHRDGHEFPLELSLSAIKEPDGWVFNAFVRDLTELRQAELELQEAQVQLLRKERLAVVGQLTATVAHELRNPMGTIRNSLYSLKTKLDKQDSDITRLADRMDRNVQRCDAIITELMDFTRDRKIILVPTLLKDWLDELLENHKVPAQIKLVRTAFPDIAIPLDATYLESAVTNVLDNAFQAVMHHHPTGGGQVDIEIKSESGRIGLVFSDNGPGIATEDHEKVFEPLYSTKVYGVGLGLPTVRKIMEKHGGEVTLENIAEGGLRVNLYLVAPV